MSAETEVRPPGELRTDPDPSLLPAPGPPSTAPHVAGHEVRRLLFGIRPGRALRWSEHQAQHGPLPRVGRRLLRPQDNPLFSEVDAAGLTGRGGAGFPTAAKLRAVSRAVGRPVVVVNGAESEPASLKDAVLLGAVPHLVLDGAEIAAAAVGAREVYVWTHRGDGHTLAAVTEAVRERRRRGGPTWRVVSGPDRYVAGESSAVVRHLSGGPAKPTTSPPRVSEKGVRGRPTLLSNAETYAQLALVARHGAAWFRTAGTREEPGTLLVTLDGAVAARGVVEVPFGAVLGDVVDAAGGTTEPVSAVLVGGYAGRWLPWAVARTLPVSRSALREAGADLGVGLFALLPQRRCGLAETARLVRWLAGESAGQCGPCWNGLPAMAGAFERLVDRGTTAAVPQLRRWSAMVTGRGACHHPDGVAALVESALDVFADAVPAHATPAGCGGCAQPPVLPLPVTRPGRQRWR